MTEKEMYQQIGESEGFFKVRMYIINDRDIEMRQSFLVGYRIGTKRRQTMDERRKATYEENRKKFIKRTGYRVAYENYHANPANLNEEDLELYYDGVIEGSRQKDLEKQEEKKVKTRKRK